MSRTSYVYLLSNRPRGTLYVGVTADLIKRIWQHKEGVVDGFTKRHALKNLVWYEIHEDILEAIKREKQIKSWNRLWKIELVEKTNAGWHDLYPDLLG